MVYNVNKKLASKCQLSERFFLRHLRFTNFLHIVASPKRRFPKLVKTHRFDGLGVNANLKLG